VCSSDLVDTEEQRAMVQESLEDQVKAASKALTDEMANLLHQANQGKKKITSATIDNYLARVQELKAMVAEYQEMLEVEMVGAQANLGLARAQAMKLLNLEAVA
jgi:DNA-binding protein H-NS